jgi:predicted enzyme related to lactoylglutathione lyase
MQKAMLKFDHMALPVANCKKSRDWYVRNLGFKVEFENSETKTIAIQDQAGFTIFLNQITTRISGAKCTLVIQVTDVDRKYRELVRKRVKFINAPQKLFWGYGAELADPDGYQINLWDKASMKKKG